MTRAAEQLRRSRGWARFSLATLLLVIACTAGYLTGIRLGHRAGKAEWDLIPAYVDAFSVGDVLSTVNENGKRRFESADDLAAYVKSEVFPITWADAGGASEIRPLPDGKTLVIATNQFVHAEIVDLLEDIRSEQRRVAAR